MIREYLKKYQARHDQALYWKAVDFFEEISYQSKMVCELKLGDYEFFLKDKELQIAKREVLKASTAGAELSKILNSMQKSTKIKNLFLYFDSNPLSDFRMLSQVVNEASKAFGQEFDNVLASFGTGIAKYDEFILFVIAN